MTKRLNIHRRQIPLFVLLGLVASTWAYATVDNRLMCRALEEASLDEVEEFAGDLTTRPGSETATVIVASREFILFGDTTGKVSVFFKTLRPDGAPQYSGIEFGFELRDEVWVMTESWMLHEGECTERASGAFGDIA
jgi:hypothetical protein